MMNHQKNTQWNRNLNQKPLKYWIRDKIEEIVKEKHVDRTRFAEYSKIRYEEIIRRFYYTYVDYEKRPKLELAYCWLYFRNSLYHGDNLYMGGAWDLFLRQMEQWIEDAENKKLYMILSQGWVYEGYCKEILHVLAEMDGFLEDFYLVSQKFDWMIAYCEDGGSAALYQV